MGQEETRKGMRKRNAQGCMSHGGLLKSEDRRPSLKLDCTGALNK
ncbi:hypothetical protein Hdeb2414_s0032g00716151 [Helianthus debilis subsp. tardiflorus]